MVARAPVARDSRPVPGRHVFTYGSLMFPEVWTRVVRGAYRPLPARVTGYARHGVRAETYPGALAAPGALLEGVLWLDVGADDLARLDRFEGPDYQRIAVRASGADARARAAVMYLYLPVERLEAVPWRPEAFDLATFLRTYGGGVP